MTDLITLAINDCRSSDIADEEDEKDVLYDSENEDTHDETKNPNKFTTSDDFKVIINLDNGNLVIRTVPRDIHGAGATHAWNLVIIAWANNNLTTFLHSGIRVNFWAYGYRCVVWPDLISSFCIMFKVD